jgi:hypothetical protein
MNNLEQILQNINLYDRTYNSIPPVRRYCPNFACHVTKVFSPRRVFQKKPNPLHVANVSSTGPRLHYFDASLFRAFVFITISEIDG